MPGMAQPAAPRRRQTDERPRPALIAPTPPGPLGDPDPDGVVRSIDVALGAARKGRRHLTLLAISVSDGVVDPQVRLEEVANLVRNMVRGTDGIWRDGPTSLAVLLADVDGPSVEPVLARLRLRFKGVLPGRTRMGRAAAAPGIGASDLLGLARADRDK